MQIGRDGQLHLSYCSNIHPANGWTEVFGQLKQFVPPLKKRLSPGRAFALGLRLSDAEARTLATRECLSRFQAFLAEENIYVPLINGFPFGAFHKEKVKDQVHAPDWQTQERVEYTRRLIRILTELLPSGMDGGISTNPLTYRHWIAAEGARASILEMMTRNLVETVTDLVGAKRETGKIIHLDLEPEADGLLNDVAETIVFFNDYLLKSGAGHLAKRLGLSPAQAQEEIFTHVRFCYDTCHAAVAFENPEEVFATLSRHGIRVGRMQISSAIRVILDEKIPKRETLRAVLNPYGESIYLHQVVQRNADGSLTRYGDLPQALKNLTDPQAREWRIHCHVPIFKADFPSFSSTQGEIKVALEYLKRNQATHHLEIETYTWAVLPDELKIDLLDSIYREYQWVLSQLGAS